MNSHSSALCKKYIFTVIMLVHKNYQTGLNEKSFLSIDVLKLPNKTLILFFCKLIILNIFSEKGPEVILYSL